MTSATLKIPVLSPDQALKKMQAHHSKAWPTYYSFYSSWFGGIIKDPGPFLVLPLDDHMVHRGDGVFEALKAVDRKIYLLEAHLKRLKSSAEKIGIVFPHSAEYLEKIVIETLQVANQASCLVRIFLSRGPGSFTANPYDSTESQLYVVVTQLNPPAPEKYQSGVKIGRSLIAVKEGLMPQIKSCNYLPNVLMKKESVDRKLDFTVSFDSDNHVAESATENLVIVDAQGILTHPLFAKILMGTTMIRAFELASKAGTKTAIRAISEKDILSAREVLMMGTTLDILPVTSYESHRISDGKVGPVANSLNALLKIDRQHGRSF